ncbi:DUF4442 domain-containing protein [Nocardioides sp. B-3]|uniref:DUF4442 domain-containing protein n=1 Tax=Nocardioides sp. B-3 TaxID=2895565 RepID=UPI002152B864|nr:DUF4442 domain-containing protein [Nocardioides sp. B-3]UUZ60062.1 DUF4442 domain-containing protein [Nocardioides sp. B-3]
MTTQPDPAALTSGIRELVPIPGAMEISVLDARRGHAAAEIPAAPNVNHFGAMYAGSLFSVAEMLGGVLGFTTFDLEGFVPIVKSPEIRFLKPATGSVRAAAAISEEEIARIEAEARGRAGRSSCSPRRSPTRPVWSSVPPRASIRCAGWARRARSTSPRPTPRPCTP